jgi:hypothetical protein
MQQQMIAQKVIYDLYNDFGQDIPLSPTNDLSRVSDTLRSQQRVLRRLLTNPGDYIWHPDYGAGLPLYVGQPLNSDLDAKIQSVILSQIFLEESVSKSPTPKIALQTAGQSLLGQIDYTVNPYGTPTTITFSVP